MSVKIELSINQTAYYVDLHSLGHVLLLLELIELDDNLAVGSAEHAFNFVNAEGAPARIIRGILEVAYVNMIIRGPFLVWSEGEEACAIESVRSWVKMIPKELKELSQIL